MIVAPDAAERQELTQLIRADLQVQGQLSSESRTVPVLVEQDFNPRYAPNYEAGDEIHYKTGSPSIEGIQHNSVVTVQEVNPKSNTIHVETVDGQNVVYNPNQLRQQSNEATVYRPEERDLAVGDRIRFTASDKDNGVRLGSFATVERIGEDNSLTVRTDAGKAVELDEDKARHIDYGYTVESPNT